MVAESVTSQWPSRLPSIPLASGSTRFFSASPCQVRAISAPAAWQALAMPQAIERLLATPRITPRLPCIRPEFCAIRFPIDLEPEFRLRRPQQLAAPRENLETTPPFWRYT